MVSMKRMLEKSKPCIDFLNFLEELFNEEMRVDGRITQRKHKRVRYTNRCLTSNVFNVAYRIGLAQEK